jgi:hypothetical protein
MNFTNKARSEPKPARRQYPGSSTKDITQLDSYHLTESRCLSLLWLGTYFLNRCWCCHISWQKDPGADCDKGDQEHQHY